MYYPKVGEILACDYGHHTIDPEMTKVRPVVVIAPRLRNRARLVGVIPLSTTTPHSVEDYHCHVTLAVPLPPPFDSPTMWAKCDMFSAVSIDRLDRFKEPRARYGGARKWTNGQATPEQIQALRAALLCGLGLGGT